MDTPFPINRLSRNDAVSPGSASAGPVLVGMSGGLDSTVAAALLQDRGFAVTGAYMRLHDESAEDEALAREAAERLSVPLLVLDFRAVFSKLVVNAFQAGYANRETPNPCFVCNRTVKFGAFLEAARGLGFSMIATGHYARTTTSDTGRTLLLCGRDRAKDQSYFLSGLSQDQLKAAVFPLGDMEKADVRRYALERGFSAATRRESQDVCFIPDGDFAAFLECRGFTFTPGRFLRPDGTELGPHRGTERYTVGQRRGLGLALGDRAYVTGRRGSDLVVGPESLLMKRRVAVRNVNYIPFSEPANALRVTAKLRYRHKAASAWLHPREDRGALLEFDSPQRAVAPGQYAVFYAGDVVVGGSEITGAE